MRPNPISADANAFSLVELTTAIGLLSFCLVALLGMLPVGLHQERKSLDQMANAQALAAIATDFRNSDSSRPSTEKYGLVAGQNATLELDEDLNDLRHAASGSLKSFHAVYTLERSASPTACDRLTLRVMRTSEAAPQNELTDFLESVILKPAP